jgi:hypothetical protein
MISRAFLLDDVMVNGGNFGRVDVTQRDSKEIKSKWKVVDFMPPKVAKGKEYLKGNKYKYTNHYGGSSIAHGFITGNFSHIYEEDSPVNRILADKQTDELWESVVESLVDGKHEGKKSGIQQAVHDSFSDIMEILDVNKALLRLTEEIDGSYKAQAIRRIQDLESYRDCTLENFKELISGLKSREISRGT